MSRKRRTRQLHQSLRNGQNRRWFHDDMIWCDVMLYDKKVAHTRLPSIGFQGWSRFLAVSLQVTWVINPAVGCHYFPPGLKFTTSATLRGLIPILVLGEQRHNGCEQFAQDCYLTASRLQFEPRPYCAWVQHANHSATEPPTMIWYDMVF